MYFDFNHKSLTYLQIFIFLALMLFFRDGLSMNRLVYSNHARSKPPEGNRQLILRTHYSIWGCKAKEEEESKPGLPFNSKAFTNDKI